jgi:hypothetical protein
MIAALSYSLAKKPFVMPSGGQKLVVLLYYY